VTALAGYWAPGFPAPRRLCRTMLAAQAAYGGPTPHIDAQDGLALGLSLHTLLPEERTSVRPLTGASGRIRLVADLRLDNRAELAAALGLTHRDETDAADSLLLLRALERWGVDAIDRLVGDFAFAWYDAAERRLRLVRDTIGTRPLFWHRSRGGFAFATMPSGLHALPDVPRAPDLEGVARFAALLHPSGAETCWEAVRRVEPGHVLEVDEGGERPLRWWHPRRQVLELPRQSDYIDAFRETVDQAVASRLRGAEGLVAAHLSAGWDSSTVAATAARLLAPTGGRVLAFTSVPAPGAAVDLLPGRIADEGPIAAAVAAMHPNMDHRLMPSSGASPIGALDVQFETFQRPMHNLCNHVWLSEIRTSACAAGARVLLSGEIGNWTVSLGPYSLLADYLAAGRVRDWARAAFKLARERRSRLRGIAARSFGPWIPGFAWRHLSRLSSARSPADDSALAPDAYPHLHRAQADHYYGRARRPAAIHSSVLRALGQIDYGEYRKGVFAGWGVDKRDPTADRRLIDFCLSLPLEQLFRDGERRPLARAALSDRLPRLLLDEQRKGYQSADWALALRRDRANVEALIEEIAACDAAASMLNIARLRELVRTWPEGPLADQRALSPYRSTLLHALSAGHFILRASRR
jgi:asparagine synthase (glutamine-hydrolysing)